MGTLLKKARILAPFPRDLVFSSTRCNGLGLLHPFFLRHIKKVRMIMGVDTMDNQSKALIQTSWEEAISESGVDIITLQESDKVISFLTNVWQQTLEFMHQYDMVIVGTNNGLTPAR